MCLQFKSFQNTGKKEKLLVTSNFSFFHGVFYPFGQLSAIFIKFEIVCKFFSVWKTLKFVIWERVKPLPNDIILDLSKLKAIANDKCDSKTEI